MPSLLAAVNVGDSVQAAPDSFFGFLPTDIGKQRGQRDAERLARNGRTESQTDQAAAAYRRLR